MPFSKYLPRTTQGFMAGSAVFKEKPSHKIKYIIFSFTICATKIILGKANNLGSLMEYLEFL